MVGQASCLSNNDRQDACPTVELRLRDLISYNDTPHQFNPTEIGQLIQAIDNCKILDPACGSGAFPMGILHKLVHIIDKLDPKNKLWKDRQLDKAYLLDDVSIRNQAIEDIEMAFECNELGYGRKLYLIENCIYGLDIQAIAIQISKLRFFISLTVDQRSDPSRNNFGIRALPNLETKFVAANTLIAIEKPTDGLAWLDDPEIQTLEQQLRDIRHRVFSAKTPQTKRDLREKDKIIREQMAHILEILLNKEIESRLANSREKKEMAYFETIIAQNGPKKEYTDGLAKSEAALLKLTENFKLQNHQIARQLAAWDPYDQNASSPFFDMEWMFGLTNGFDVVIGNPPYVRQEAIKHLKKDLQSYQVYNGTADIYTYFYEMGFNLLKDGGILTFITSNKWMRAAYGEKLRHFFLSKTKLLQLIDFKGKQVFDATVDTNILVWAKGTAYKEHTLLTGHDIPTAETPLAHLPQNSLNKQSFHLGNSNVQALKAKIEAQGVPLKEWEININFGIKTGFNEAFIIDTATKERLCQQDPTSAEIIKPILRGRDIRRYGYEWAGLWLINAHNGLKSKGIKPINVIKDYPAVYGYLRQFERQLIKRQDKGDHWTNLRNCTYLAEFEQEKVIYSEIVRSPQFYFDDNAFYVEATSFLMTGKHLKYLLALLNSKAVTFFFKTFYAGGGLGESGFRYKKAFLENLPVPQISEVDQQPFIALVDQILAVKRAHAQADTSIWERQIDELVYQLYGLTMAEVAGVTGVQRL